MKRKFFVIQDSICNGSLVEGSFICLKGGSIPQKVLHIYRRPFGYALVLVNAYADYHIVEVFDAFRFYRPISKSDFLHFLLTIAGSSVRELYRAGLLPI